MARFRFSRRAEADLLSIGDYTLRTWGKTQAAHYIGELQDCCQTLADNPALGRLCDLDGVFSGHGVLYERACVFWKEPGKQKPRSCRAQELARSRAQGNAWQKLRTYSNQ